MKCHRKASKLSVANIPKFMQYVLISDILKRRQNTMELGQDMTLVSGTNEHSRLKLAQSVATATNIRNVQQEIANSIFAINEDTMKRCVQIN